MFFDHFDLFGYSDQLNQAVDMVYESKFVIIVGNGGSAAIASHMSTDLNLWGKLASSLNEPGLMTALSNDFTYSEVYSRQISVWPDGGLLIAISSSGNSMNILNAVDMANTKEYKIITLSGFDPNNRLCHRGDLNIHVPSTDYGIVESVHAVLLHYIVNEVKSGQVE